MSSYIGDISFSRRRGWVSRVVSLFFQLQKSSSQSTQLFAHTLEGDKFYLRSWHQPGHLFTIFLQKYTSALSFFMDHSVPVWCSVATTQAILERFDPGSEIGEMKSQTKYSVHRLMMMQTGQKPPQHWRRAFHFPQQHLNSWMWSLDSAS